MGRPAAPPTHGAAAPYGPMEGTPSGALSPPLYPLFWVLKRNPSKNREGGGVYVVALDGRRSAKKNTTTNQKQAAVTDGTMEGRRDEREAWGSAMSLFLEGGKYER